MIDADILMITHNRPEYTGMALERLLETCPACSRVWIWQNGTDELTRQVVRKFESHPRVSEVVFSEENRLLREPTNWFWRSAQGSLLGKVDDDCLVPEGWLETLARIHRDEHRAGVLSCWPFLPDDYRDDISRKKFTRLAGGHGLLQNCWTGGSGYLMKRLAVERNGLLGPKDSFPNWCIRLAFRGFLNGYPLPLLLMDHMDDPLSPNTRIRSEDDFRKYKTLSSQVFGTNTYEEYCRRARTAALNIQVAPLGAWRYVGIAGWARRGLKRLTGRSYVTQFRP
jgi:GT2 family glycosyltransferase